jgi:hypothetical protein
MFLGEVGIMEVGGCLPGDSTEEKSVHIASPLSP